MRVQQTAKQVVQPVPKPMAFMLDGNWLTGFNQTQLCYTIYLPSRYCLSSRGNVVALELFKCVAAAGWSNWSVSSALDAILYQREAV